MRAKGPSFALFPQQLADQFRQVRVSLAASIVFCLLVLGGALAVSLIENVSPADMTRDALQTMRARFYIGFVSSVGILLWMAAATACLLASAVLRGVRGGREAAGFYLWFGLLTLQLTLDDQFLFHEKIWPFATGLPQCMISGLYGLLLVAFLIRFRAVVLKSHWLLLGLSVASLGISAGMDLKPLEVLLQRVWDEEIVVFVEDSFKLFGIVFWFLYFVRCALNDLRTCGANRDSV